MPAMKLAVAMIAAVLALPLAGCSSSRDSNQLVVAIVDTGIATDLGPFEQFDIKQVESNPSGDHGTMIASVILGVNGTLTSLPDERVHVLSLDVGRRPDAEKLADAIDIAIEAKVDVISISLGLRRDHPSLRAAVMRAEQAGIPILAAAGNVRFMPPDYPARYESVISVSAVDGTGAFWADAVRFGVDAVAQGVDVPALDMTGETQVISGTSVSTAILAHELLAYLLTDSNAGIEGFRFATPPAQKDHN